LIIQPTIIQMSAGHIPGLLWWCWLTFGPKQREVDHVANTVTVRQQHHETINAYSQASCRRHTNL
jgi:hypothetical protein